MFYLAGLRVQGPVSRLCALTPWGEGEGASRPPCTTHASGQSTMYKASRLIYSFLAYFRYIQRAGSALLQAILATRRFTFLCTLQIILYICTVCFQAALKAASHHSDTLVYFFVSIVTASVTLVSCLIFQSILQCSLHSISQPPHIRYCNWTETTLRTPRVQSVK